MIYTKSKYNWFIKIVALGLIVLFFCPMFTVSCEKVNEINVTDENYYRNNYNEGETKMSFSSFEVLTGKEGFVGHLQSVILVIVPILIFVASFLFKNKSRKMCIIELILSFIGMVALILFAWFVYKMFIDFNEYHLFKLKLNFAYYISGFLYFLIFSVSLPGLMIGVKFEKV